MNLTPKQIAELLSIIDKYTFTFIAHKVGVSVLDPVSVTSLNKYGINTSKIAANSSTVGEAFKFGILSNALEDGVVKNMTYSQLKNHISSGKMFKLNNIEKQAIEVLKRQTYNDIMRLGSKMKSNISDALVKVSKSQNTVQHTKLVTDAAKKAIEDRKGLASVISEIGHKSGEWNRDLGRIGDYVMHSAFDEGRLHSIVKEGGTFSLVYKDVYAGACKHCQKAYLTGGVGSQPKIFKASDLQSNGTNIGKKVAEWKPVIGPMHPWCRCTIMSVPSGFTLEGLQNGEWEWDGVDFIRNYDKFERKVKRTSKVKITVNGKTRKI